MQQVAYCLEELDENWIKLADVDQSITKYPGMIFDSINHIVDSSNVKNVSLTFLNNKFDNQILAVTVTKMEVEKSKNPDKWEQARQTELASLKKFGVFTEIDRQDIPNNHPDPIGCRWLYTLKQYPYDTYQKNEPEAENGAIYKARLIVQGMNEECDDTYSPTPMSESIRLIISLAVINNWDIKFTDVSTAFLHADVIGHPYVFPPDTEGMENTNIVWKLNKAQYGLKSAPKAWNKHLTNVLKKLGWIQSVLDECIFLKRNLYPI